MTFRSHDPAPAGHAFVAIGPHCWGRGDTIDRAKRRAGRAKPASHDGRFRYAVVLAPEDAQVGPFGDVQWTEHTCTVAECGQTVRSGGSY